MLEKSMSGDDIAAETNRIITHQHGLDPDKCRAMMADSCAAQVVGMDALLKVFRKAVKIGCLSHTFNNIGKQMKTPELDTFAGKLHTLLSHSPYAKNLFLATANVRAPSTPSHRWGSRFERDLLLAMNFPGLEKFVGEYETGDEDGLFMEDVSLPTVDALIAQQIGQGDDLVSSISTSCVSMFFCRTEGPRTHLSVSLPVSNPGLLCF